MGVLPLGDLIRNRLSQMRSPVLFVLAAILFGLDVLIPDLIPFVDEILLGIGTLLLARRKKPAPPGTAPPRGRTS
jgi:hypothetical protein